MLPLYHDNVTWYFSSVTEALPLLPLASRKKLNGILRIVVLNAFRELKVGIL